MLCPVWDLVANDENNRTKQAESETQNIASNIRKIARLNAIDVEWPTLMTTKMPTIYKKNAFHGSLN